MALSSYFADIVSIYTLYDETGKMANNPENSKIPKNPVRGNFGIYIRTEMEIPPNQSTPIKSGKASLHLQISFPQYLIWAFDGYFIYPAYFSDIREHILQDILPPLSNLHLHGQLYKHPDVIQHR